MDSPNKKEKFVNELVKQVNKEGLFSISKITGLHPNKILSIIGKSMSTDVMVDFIQDVIGETGGFGLTEVGEDPIIYGSNKDEVREINFLGISSVIVDVYDYDMTKHLGEFRKSYINLSDDIIKQIYNVIIDVYNENFK